MSNAAGRDVALYVEGDHELAVLEPIGSELARRGADVRTTRDFDEAAEIGLYACHANRFYDFRAGAWRHPPNELSALALHDFGQAGTQDSGYFSAEPWHAVDLGLLPGPLWASRWDRAAAGGASGPALGMHAIGWPKMDHVHASPEGFARRVEALRADLGLGARPVVVLACSWSDRRQLADALDAVDLDEIDLVVKYPATEPPPQDSPWFDRLTAAREELGLAREIAHAEPRVVVAQDSEDIMTLVATADVVLSNGSNVLYEGVLAGVPGVSVRDWVHPAGRYGEQTVEPSVDLTGVLSGGLDSLPAMMRVVQDECWAPLVTGSSELLVDPGTRGRAAAAAADIIEAALVPGERERSWRREVNLAGAVGEGEVDELQLRDSELERAAKQLQAYESELELTRIALAAADAREVNARHQLKAYEQQLAELQGRSPS